jgi:hypothetical protein
MENSSSRLLIAMGVAAALIIGLVAVACLFVSYIYPNYLAAPIQPDTDQINTQAAQTIMANLTQTGVVNTPEFTELPPSATLPPTSTGTQLLTATSTAIPPTATPVPPTPTPTAIPCNWIQFIDDVTVKDGTVFPPNNMYTKTWRLKNIGLCTWTRDYMLVFDSGERMDGPAAVQIGENVDPGETVDLSVELISPKSAGKYRGNWLLSTPGDQKFGLGAGADNPFWVEINVIESDKYVYDFALNYCNATWTSGAGNLPCPGEAGDEDGFVNLLDNPIIEIDRLENEPALWTVPQRTNDGFIRGVYPEIKIEAGNHFKTVVGCLNDSKKCDLLFRINYRVGDGEIQTLREIREVYDGKITNVDIDLSTLDGQNVKFILEVNANGAPDGDNGFWLLPRID